MRLEPRTLLLRYPGAQSGQEKGDEAENVVGFPGNAVDDSIHILFSNVL